VSDAIESRTCTAILVLEDEEGLRTEVARHLEAEGFQVYQAENGASALQLLQVMSRPALVLADLMMPSATGPDLIGTLRPGDRLVILPVVSLSEAEIDGSEYVRRKQLVSVDGLLRIARSLCWRRT
jgi:DNA-binding response OmpR family regulator